MELPKSTRQAHPGAEGADREARRTVIPAPRRDGLFGGWGVRF